jgi:PAS domain S-box-containing protein
VNHIIPPHVSVEERLRRAEDSLVAISSGDVDLLVGAKEPLVVRFRSLFEEKERQRLLLDTLVESAPTLIVLTDSQDRITRFNATCEALTGYSREEALGKTIAELFRAPGWEEVGTAPFVDPLASILTAPQSVHCLTKGGEQRQIEWRHAVIAAPVGEGRFTLGIGLDVTERKKAEDAAAEARRFAESIIATMRESLLVLDGSLRVEAANQSFYQTFQVEPEETIGRLFFDLQEHQWESPALRQLLEDLLPQDTSFDDFEFKHDFPRLGRRVMQLNGRRVLREKGGTARILLAIEDVTEKVQAREALNNLNRELEDRVRERTAELQSANKELEAFGYSVSHDLRAPLRALDGFSDELLRRYAEQVDEQGKHYLQRIRAGTQRMGELIDDLLQLSRIGRRDMKREHVDLAALACAISAELRQREPERQVSFDIQPDLTAQGDSGLLKAALENLLGNAWKFTGKKSSATIAFGRVENQGRAAFFVSDNGAGFDMSHASKLFGAFQRLHTQREFPGNGIGLATVQRIIHRHGGQVWADSPPGQGATFYFTLPMKEPL